MADAILSVPRVRDHVFFSSMAIAMALVVFAGFAPSFFLRPLFPEAAARAAPEAVFYVHGAIFAGWMALLVVQTSLIRIGNVRRHMQLGVAGAMLAGVMIPVGIHAAIVAAQRPGGFTGVPLPPLQFLTIPFGDMVLFAAFVALALFWRGRPQSHKRLMLLATISLLNAATARLVFSSPLAGIAFLDLVFVDLFVIALFMWDFASRRRIHPVTLFGGLAIILSQPFRLWLGTSDAWLAFAAWATGAG